jgi:2-amino-4-hydroxy-6-hydroxymethyldihydropteridine diphosphokinase
MQLAYLALGSNQGPRKRQLRDAVHALGRLPATRLLAVSGLYETVYVGPGEQGPYLNACVRLATECTPEELLECTQELERAAGREPDSHMAPRTLDIDLLIVGEERRMGDDLQLPHPRMLERRFVMEPLADLDPELVPPGATSTVRELSAAAELRAQELRLLSSGAWWEEDA